MFVCVFASQVQPRVPSGRMRQRAAVQRDGRQRSGGSSSRSSSSTTTTTNTNTTTTTTKADKSHNKKAQYEASVGTKYAGNKGKQPGMTSPQKKKKAGPKKTSKSPRIRGKDVGAIERKGLLIF